MDKNFTNYLEQYLPGLRILLVLHSCGKITGQACADSYSVQMDLLGHVQRNPKGHKLLFK